MLKKFQPLCFASDQVNSVCYQSFCDLSYNTDKLEHSPMTFSTGAGMCEDDSFSLHENYTITYRNVSAIGGTPLYCIFGQYSALCNDNTTDPSSADVLCAEIGYYGQLVEMHFT